MTSPSDSKTKAVSKISKRKPSRSYGEYYLKYLLSIPGNDIEDVVTQADETRLPVVSNTYLRGLDSEISGRPRNYNPGNPRNKASDGWLEGHKIREMWRRTRGARQALRILTSPRLRELVEAYLLSPLEVDDYIDRLPIWLSPWGVRTYAHYFFNMDLLDRAEVASVAEGTGGLRELLAKCDPDRDVVHAMMAYGTGVGLVEIPMNIISRKAVDIAGNRLLQMARSQASLEDALALKRYIGSLEIGQRILMEAGAAADDIRKLFESVVVSTEGQPERVPTFEEVVVGKYKIAPARVIEVKALEESNGKGET